jgi:2-keto-4-pentenoate hydratase/2-oxohepta-3-ene-1,7-dioic acid hydratase in catechol pathway
MRLYTLLNKKNKSILAAEANGKLIDINAAYSAASGRPGPVAEDMIAFIKEEEINKDKALQAIDYALNHADPEFVYDFAEVTIESPVKHPGKIFCSGLNYKSHVTENPNAKFLTDPRFFSKAPSIVIGPGEPIKHPGEKFQVDWEVELAVVFGKKCHRAGKENAMKHVFGYSILHDVSARYIQFKDNNEVMGKNFDTFCPIGPCIVTADEIPEPEKLRLSTRINGKTVQDGSNEDWCFSLPHLIEWLSMAITLEAGDILSTGTPAGIGLFHQPPVYLKPGDVAELEISKIGKLINPVVADFYEGREV